MGGVDKDVAPERAGDLPVQLIGPSHSALEGEAGLLLQNLAQGLEEHDVRGRLEEQALLGLPLVQLGEERGSVLSLVAACAPPGRRGIARWHLKSIAQPPLHAAHCM